MRIYCPPGPGTLRPCVYWIHGGGYITGSALSVDPRLNLWAETLDCVVAAVDYRRYRYWAIPIYGLCILMLLAVLVVGHKSRGSQAWFQIGSYQLEPSEFVKIGLIVALASYCAAAKGHIRARALLVVLALSIVPFALIYKQRWLIELFFRFFKHLLGCRNLFSQQAAGIQIQAYCAIIACWLLSLWTGGRPTLRTYEMLCLYWQGWADLDELTAHREKLRQQQKTK